MDILSLCALITCVDAHDHVALDTDTWGEQQSYMHTDMHTPTGYTPFFLQLSDGVSTQRLIHSDRGVLVFCQVFPFFIFFIRSSCTLAVVSTYERVDYPLPSIFCLLFCYTKKLVLKMGHETCWVQYRLLM